MHGLEVFLTGSKSYKTHVEGQNCSPCSKAYWSSAAGVWTVIEDLQCLGDNRGDGAVQDLVVWLKRIPGTIGWAACLELRSVVHYLVDQAARRPTVLHAKMLVFMPSLV